MHQKSFMHLFTTYRAVQYKGSCFADKALKHREALSSDPVSSVAT